MRLNQVTVTMPDLDAGWAFYGTLGLQPIVDARPHYVRFVCPDGGSSFSLHQGEATGGGTTVYFECNDLDLAVSRLIEAGILFASSPADKSWLWREAEVFDPAGNRIVLYFAGTNRLDPPWRVPATAAQ
ncbi:glyoxalase/bleomycin resistance/extradiol dioxygenase family protein [Sinorhizobium sp. A49]|uniref:VOC family protein n=1 Tax=Sinorhizobium sp. A49 TaxID=1945861 RepID=UPI0009876B5F|nr:VOC family protein [Sinorhizobium sp. A49]OOG73456.1 glyoxalase/bleomycin resistance/extradiol dioxygenase family protein [Sinorhizobium sp. A49]